MRIYLDLEAGPPPMTEAEKLAALPDSKRPKEPPVPFLKPVASNITKPDTIAVHEARNLKAYEHACAEYAADIEQWDRDCIEAAEDAWRWLAVKPRKAVVNTIGWAFEGHYYQVSGEDTRAVLQEFEAALPPNANALEWVTWNGKGYDLPLLWRWAAKFRLRRLRDAIPWSPMDPYQRRHVDLMGRDFVKFEDVCQDYLGEGKTGSEDPVGDWLDPERRHLLIDRNYRDVELLVMLDEVWRD